MTDRQRAFYWRLWGDCCAANGWRTRQGRLEHDPARLNEMGLQLWPIAERLAGAAHRAVTLDDLRHGCHVLALGRDKSSTALSNAEFNRVLTCLKLIVDYENLEALMDWQNAGNAERRSFIAFLRKKAPEAVLATISNNAFGTRHWQGLEIQKLRWLAGQLKNRPRRLEQTGAERPAGGGTGSRECAVLKRKETTDEHR